MQLNRATALLALLSLSAALLAHGATMCGDELCAACDDAQELCIGCVDGYAIGGNGSCIDANLVPNLVLFSHDDALIDSAWDLAYNQIVVPSGARNPNGCRLPITWFVSKMGRDEGDCSAVQQAYQHGHELATHTLNHSDVFDTLTYDELVPDINGLRVGWLNETCGVPAELVTGFRAPNFLASHVLGQVLADLDFEYDSSYPALDYYQRAGRLDEGFNMKCKKGVCLDWEGLPIWEVPTYGLPPDDTSRLTNPEPQVDEATGMNFTIFDRFKADFERKRGTSVPTAILVHENYLEVPEQRDAVIQFVQYALAQNNTWLVTYQQYIAYLRAPEGTPIEEVLSEYPCDDS